MEQKDTAYTDAIATNLTDWITLSNTLGFCTSQDPAKCDCKQAYMLYWWMDTLLNETFKRQIDGGNTELGVMPTLGQIAFEGYMV